MKNPIVFILISCIFNPMQLLSRHIPASHPFIQYCGRWDRSDPDQPKHSWPGVSVCISFHGTRIGVCLDDTINFHNVYIDGQFQGVFHGSSDGETDYILADNLEDTTHTLRFSKRNSSFGRIFSFSGFILNENGDLLKPPDQLQLKFEFLGNSFTAAEGNEAERQEMDWEETIPVTNIDKGFAAVTADFFGAQYHTICRPGIGLVHDWTGDSRFNLPAYFNRTLMEAAEPEWNFQQWIPDLVVICLGLNDYSGFGGWQGDIDETDAELFISRYHHFIQMIRDVYPGVQIIAFSPHVEWLKDQVRQVVESEKARGHADVFYADFDYYEGGYVANSHPSVETHLKISKALINTIKQIPIFPSNP